MTREQAREAAAVMLAWADGKKVEFKCISMDWRRTDTPEWNWTAYNYRIKPTAKLRPWTADEVPLGAQCRKIGDSKRFLIVRTSDESMRSEWAENCEHSTDGGKTWLPCGVEESKP